MLADVEPLIMRDLFFFIFLPGGPEDKRVGVARGQTNGKATMQRTYQRLCGGRAG